jgi:glycosyltransferase involved in cell wall biosynthesis
MMSKKLLSLALATYNMEKYLPRCLDSVLAAETLDRIEVIVVNDGSADSTLSIMQQYWEKYPQAVVIVDKPNGHYGSCINAALKIATGKYFRPLDPDDCFDSHNFIQFLEVLSKADADIVFSNYSKEYPNGVSKTIISNAGAITPMLEYSIDTFDFKSNKLENLLSLPCMTYKTSILQDMDFYQQERIAYTDMEYCFYPLSFAKSFIYADLVLYKYSIGRAGQTVAISSMLKNKEHSQKIANRMVEYCKQNGHLNAPQKRILQQNLQFLYVTILVLQKKLKKDAQYLSDIDSWLKDYSPEIYENMNCYPVFIVVKFIKLWRKYGIYASKFCGKFLYHIQKKLDFLVKGK